MRNAVIMILLTSNLSAQASSMTRYLNESELHKRIADVYGERAVLRVKSFARIMSPRVGISEQQKLTLVNNYFNNLTYSEDNFLWGQSDYWANPLEFIGARGGDCEDYSISKYYALMELGVDEKKLRMAYVKAIKYNQFHMVVLYYTTPKSDPLVLDNIKATIYTGSQRTDLLPVYSFNAKSLWIMKSRKEGTFSGSSERLSKWKDFQTRFSDEYLKIPRKTL